MADPQLLMLFWEVLETSGWGWLEEGDTGVSLIPSCHSLSFLLSQEDSCLLRRGPHCHLLPIHMGSHNCPQNSESIRKCTSLQLFLQHLVAVIERVTRRLLNVLVNISWSPCWKLTKYPHTTAQHTFLGVIFLSLLASVSSRQKWSLPQDKFPRLWLWQGYCTHFMGSVDTVRLIKPGHLFLQGTPNELILSFHYPSTHMHTIMSSNNRINFLSILIILFLFQNIVHWLEV